MKEIKLTNSNKVILVDDEDFERLNKFKWWIDKKGYARTSLYNDGKTKTIKMHKDITNTDQHDIIDHKDRNKLNNQKENLRKCTVGQNNANADRSKTDGIYWTDKKQRWTVAVAGKHKAYFRKEDKIAALNCYNYYAKQKFGEFASLNDIEYVSKEEWENKKCKRSSEYYGVSYDYTRHKWTAKVGLSSVFRKWLGYFETEIEAAQAYNDWLDENLIIIKPKNIIPL